MNEELLQYAWKHRLFETQNLKTISGEPVEVLKPGTWNYDSGPDFFNATVRVGQTKWVGNIEIHQKTSDWLSHNHQHDESYNNVILHVVAKHNRDVALPNGNYLPTVEIEIHPSLLKNYEQLISQKDTPACGNYIYAVNPVYVRSAMDAMLVDRLNSKTSIIAKNLAQNKNNWNETFYQHLASNFGFKVNVLPFEMLARSLPLKTLGHHSRDILQTEALLFGQSGLLNETLIGDDYFLSLRKEYQYLASKYKLKGIDGFLWKFMRLRPANFPTIRIAQFASLLCHSEALLSKIIDTEKPEEILQYFQVKASGYWDTHYRFNKTAPEKIKWFGVSSRNNLIINTVVPFLYLYGDRNNKPELKARSVALLEAIAPENNHIIKLWKSLGIPVENAYDTQALIQLKNEYCNKKRCLECQIGAKLLKHEILTGI
ncbi:MAG: DUF2851 family protein [Prolixibacteraceae bacterium]|nr:DUF2851 family protein [Prolixibacteraceae bacterium]